MTDKKLIVEGDPATCISHFATGSQTVKVGAFEKGASKVLIDLAGGVILGPGAPTVFIENSPASLEGDLIAPHGKSPHSNATTTALFNQTVFIGQ
jgi:hypothetical protein